MVLRSKKNFTCILSHQTESRKNTFFSFFDKKISISPDKLPMKRSVNRQTMSRKFYKSVKHPISYILTVLERFYDRNSLLCAQMKKNYKRAIRFCIPKQVFIEKHIHQMMLRKEIIFFRKCWEKTEKIQKKSKLKNFRRFYLKFFFALFTWGGCNQGWATILELWVDIDLESTRELTKNELCYTNSQQDNQTESKRGDMLNYNPGESRPRTEKPLPVRIFFRFFPQQCNCMLLENFGEHLKRLSSSKCTLWPLVSLQMSTPGKNTPKSAKKTEKNGRNF